MRDYYNQAFDTIEPDKGTCGIHTLSLQAKADSTNEGFYF